MRTFRIKAHHVSGIISPARASTHVAHGRRTVTGSGASPRWAFYVAAIVLHALVVLFLPRAQFAPAGKPPEQAVVINIQDPLKASENSGVTPSGGGMRLAKSGRTHSYTPSGRGNEVAPPANTGPESPAPAGSQASSL